MKKSKQLISYIKYTVLICFINTMAYGQCSLTSGPNHSVINYECPQDILYITATVPYNGVLAKGRAYTKFGAGNGGQYKKPLIMVEGLDLDIGDNHDQGHRIGDRGWPNFIAGISNEREPNDHILDDLPILINNLKHVLLLIF